MRRFCLRGSVNEVAVGDERVAYAWALHLIHEAERSIAVSLRPLQRAKAALVALVRLPRGGGDVRDCAVTAAT